MKPKSHGGARQGAGRPISGKEETKPITIRVPVSKIEAFKTYVKKWLNKS